MRRRIQNAATYLIVTAILVGGANVARAVAILSIATPTIDLPTNNADQSQGSIGYHPGFNQYYGGDVGDGPGPGYVWSASGTLLQTTDRSSARYEATNYNPNTNAIEITTYAANVNDPSAPDHGLITMGLDGSGLYNGANVETLPYVPALKGYSTMPAYDPTLDRLYSSNTNIAPSNQVNVVSRATGASLGFINLDLAAAGVTAPDIVAYALGFDPANNVLISLDHTNHRALVHDLSGSYLGASQLPTFATSVTHSMGFANNQLFVLNTSSYEYRGFQILDRAQTPEPATLALLGLGVAGVGFQRVKRSKA